ncbi:MAG: aminotransferase class V-fold PLP-dependent enzyme, partial [Ginsengibacter sp.]
IYAGAQKNMGAAGTNLVVVNKNILGKIKRSIPPIMDYQKHIEAKSMLNTPPVFAIYVSMLTLKWLKENGGIPAMEKINNAKAAMLYEAIDSNKVFKGTARVEDRSNMNVCFVAEDKNIEKQFLDFSEKNNIYGIKGHRHVGGFRVSLYNALPVSSVSYLIEKMHEFEKIL